MTVTELTGPFTCVRLQGRLDAPGADLIGIRFTATTAGAGLPTLVDLSNVDFVASMGIRLLISAARSLRLKGAGFALFGANAMVQEVLLDTGLDQIIPVCATEAEAVACLAI